MVVPFVLALLAAVWDLRQFIAYRTELAREMYVLAEAIANDTQGGAGGAAPFEEAIEAAQERFEPRSASGVIHAVVVVRGQERADGTACPDGGWCPPLVQVAWPGTATDPAGTWAEGANNPCTPSGGAAFPAQGAHFATGRRVLPDEGAAGTPGDPALAEADWVSRNIGANAWWVVVDTCVEPPEGLFVGRLAGLSAPLLRTPFVWRRRAAWPSIHDLGACAWCAGAAAEETAPDGDT